MDENAGRPIYVFGNPLFYELSGRPPSMPINGWGWEYNLPEQWAGLYRSLSDSQPAYVYLDDYYLELLQRNSPETLSFLERAFRVVMRDDEGTLYKAVGATP